MHDLVSLNSRGEPPLSEEDVSAEFANKSQLIKKDLSDETLDSESDDDADKVYEEDLEEYEIGTAKQMRYRHWVLEHSDNFD